MEHFYGVIGVLGALAGLYFALVPSDSDLEKEKYETVIRSLLKRIQQLETELQIEQQKEKHFDREEAGGGLSTGSYETNVYLYTLIIALGVAGYLLTSHYGLIAVGIAFSLGIILGPIYSFGPRIPTIFGTCIEALDFREPPPNDTAKEFSTFEKDMKKMSKRK